jgi:hypothetical protein
LIKKKNRNLTLNFNSTQVIIHLYPYANKNREDYKYRLFEIVYVASVNSNEQFISKYISTEKIGLEAIFPLRKQTLSIWL